MRDDATNRQTDTHYSFIIMAGVRESTAVPGECAGSSLFYRQSIDATALLQASARAMFESLASHEQNAKRRVTIKYQSK